MFLSLLLSRGGLITMAVLAVVALFGVQEIRLKGAQHSLEKIEAAQKLAKADVATHEATAQAVTQTVKADLATEKVRVETVTRTLIKRIPADVPDQADRDCSVPVGWSRLWLAGAAGSDPGFPVPAGGSEKPAAGAPHAP